MRMHTSFRFVRDDMQQELRPAGCGESLGALAVQLLSLERADFEHGARRASNLGLAGIYQLGLTEMRIAFEEWNPVLLDALARARRREVADGLASIRHAGQVLSALVVGGVQPVVLKGLPLAGRFWPEHWMRPTGDLDLLVEAEALAEATEILARLDYRPSPAALDESGASRPPLASVPMMGRAPGSCVDLHTRLFRTVGAGILTRDVLERAVPASLASVPVRVLEPADEILFLMVHASKHGAIHPKWLLDLHALRLAHPHEVWALAVERAMACRATRSCWAAVRLLDTHPPLRSAEAKRLRPPPLARVLISRFVLASPDEQRVPQTRWQKYALEWLLEDRLALRIRRLLGVIARALAGASATLASRGRAPSVGELRNERWLEGALSGGGASPVWVTLRGASMTPAVLPGDRLMVTPLRPSEELRVGDIFVARKGRRLVAHRLLGTLDGAVILRGDAAVADDAPIPLGDVLARAVVTHHVNETEVMNERDERPD